MKKYSLLFLAILFLATCEKESTSELKSDEATYEDGTATTRSSNKRDVCHNGNIININVNAIPAHRAHGDAVDMDGDGFFDIDNPCGETDCDDNDPSIGACPSITWSGPTRGQCFTQVDVTELVGVPSFLWFCQANRLDLVAFYLVARSDNQDLNCYGGYSPISGTVTVEQNGVVVEGNLVDNGFGIGEFFTPFKIENGPVTATLTSWSVGNIFNCDLW